MSEPYKIVITEDLSPSLETLNSSNISETMHSRRGAFSETLFIYGKNISQLIEHKLSPKILSVGLGLGYNEVLATGMYLAHAPDKLDELYIESYESEAPLRGSFCEWLNGSKETKFYDIYTQILNLTASHLDINPNELMNSLTSLFKNRKIEIKEALDLETVFSSKFTSILFDAYSAKMSPKLWSEELLNKVLSASDEDCILSTYAAKGGLTRALKQAGFTVSLDKGFKGKRNHTHAIKKKSLV